MSQPCVQSTAIFLDILRCSAAPWESPPQTQSFSCKCNCGDRCTYSSTTSLQQIRRISKSSGMREYTCISLCFWMCVPVEEDMVTHRPFFLRSSPARCSAQFWNSTSVLSLHLRTKIMFRWILGSGCIDMKNSSSVRGQLITGRRRRCNMMI